MIKFFKENIIFVISSVLLVGIIASANMLEKKPTKDVAQTQTTPSTDTVSSTTNTNIGASQVPEAQSITTKTPSIPKKVTIPLPRPSDDEEEYDD